VAEVERESVVNTQYLHYIHWPGLKQKEGGVKKMVGDFFSLKKELYYTRKYNIKPFNEKDPED
jgi:hypothetical protein